MNNTQCYFVDKFTKLLQQSKSPESKPWDTKTDETSLRTEWHCLSGIPHNIHIGFCPPSKPTGHRCVDWNVQWIYPKSKFQYRELWTIIYIMHCRFTSIRWTPQLLWILLSSCSKNSVDYWSLIIFIYIYYWY